MATSISTHLIRAIPKTISASYKRFAASLAARTLLVLLLSSGLVGFSTWVDKTYDDTRDSGGTSLVRFPSFTQMALNNEYLNLVLGQENYFIEKPEPASVRILKQQYQDVLSGAYFSSLEDVFRYLRFLGHNQATIDVLQFAIGSGLFFPEFDCIAVDDCVAAFKARRVRNRDALRIVSALEVFATPALMELGARSAAGTLNLEIEQFLVSLKKVDFDFDYLSSPQRTYSKFLLVLAFFNIQTGYVDRSYTTDLENFFDWDVDRRGQYTKISDRRVRLYRKAVEEYYSGCFETALEDLQEFAALTNNEFMNELALLLRLRILTRPLVRHESFVRADSQSNLIVMSCERQISLDSWESRLRTTLAQVPDEPAWAGFADDFEYLAILLREHEGRVQSLQSQHANSDAEAEANDRGVKGEQRKAEANGSPTSGASNAASSKDDGVDRPTGLSGGNIVVQIGAFETEDLANFEMDELQVSHKELFSGKEFFVEEASSGGRTFFRLRLRGFSDIGDARAFCGMAVFLEINCIPIS